MAIGRLSVTAGHKGEANTWYDYVMREGVHAPEQGDTERVILKESGNMPYWAKDDPRFFWEMADDKEPYQNGTTYRQHIVTLPRGLSDEQLIELAKRHIDKHNGGKFAYTMAIHCPIGMDGKEQPHLHYMFNEKIIDGIERGADTYFKRYNAKNPEKGGGKKDNTGLTHEQRDIQLQEVRNEWEVTCNEYLASIGRDDFIDMRNWKDRGETKAPVNISMKAMFNKEVKQAYKDKVTAQVMLEQAQADITALDLETELTNAKDRLAREVAKFEHHQGIQSRLEKLTTYDNAQLTASELRQFEKATYKNITNSEHNALNFINDTITKIKMGEPLSKATESDYRFGKALLNHTQEMRNSGALEQLRQTELEQIRLAQEQQQQQKIQSQLEYMLDTVGEILPPEKYAKWQTLTDTALSDYLADYQQRASDLLQQAHNELLTPEQVAGDKVIKDVIATITDITSIRTREREELAREQAKRLATAPTATATHSPIRWTDKEQQAIEYTKKVMLDNINKLPEHARKSALDTLDKSMDNLTHAQVQKLVESMEKQSPPPPPPTREQSTQPQPTQSQQQAVRVSKSKNDMQK